MKIPVRIKIKDNKKFGNVAFLVDRDDFLKDLELLRSKWEIGNPIPYELADKWQQRMRESKKATQEYRVAWDKFQKKWTFKLGKFLPPEARDDWWKVHRILPFWEFYFDVDKLRVKYHKPHFFHRIIAVVLIHGEIRERDYSTVTLIPFGASFSSGFFTGLSPSASAIIQVTKETTEVELLEVFHKFKKMPSDNTYEKSLFSGESFNPDTISNIERDRKWYWLNKGGLGYEKISQQAKSEGIVITWSAVRAAIKQYKNRLALSV